MKINDDILNQYLNSSCTDSNDYLNILEKETIKKISRPNMISGKYQGRFLSILSKIVKPKYILEIGTYTGYSALCLAEGLLDKHSKLISIDNNDNLINTFTRNKINNSDKANSIELIIGEAMDIIPSLNYTFDIVFIDADKKNYINYFNLSMGKTKSGSIIISDNVLWKEKVYNDGKKDSLTKSLIEYNNYLKNDNRIETIILPIRDGISISYVL